MPLPRVDKILITWEEWRDRILERAATEEFDGIEIVISADRKIILKEVSDAQVLQVGALDAEILDRGNRLQWIHAMVGGAGHYLFPELVDSPIPLTCSKPCFGTAGAEHALAAMLIFSRRFHRLRRPPMTQWDPGRDGELQPFDLAGKTVGIIGLGYMGRAIARVCSSLGMRVLGTARRPRRRVDSVHQLFSLDRLPELLAASDFVVLAVPLTRETRGFMGRPQLRAMKPSAYLIDSSGRPPLLDYAALERALEEGWIAGVCLQPSGQHPDVRMPAANSGFWKHPQVVVTPCRGTSREQEDAVLDLFFRNLRRFRRSEPLEGLVDKSAGY